MKVIHTNMTKRIVGSFLAIFVMMFSVVCFAPVLLVSDVDATGVDFTVNNTNVILEMYIPASVTLNLLPSSGRAFDVQTLPIWIGTNSGAGYTLKMQTDSASLTRISSITDREGNKTFPTIAPMTTVGSTTGYTEEQFMSDNSDSDTLNRWGYKLSTNTNYIPITTNEITLSSTNAPSNGTNIGVDFAAKIDASQPTGLYATTLNFVAVTNNTNTAFTINFDGNGLHFGNDPNNTVNVVTYDATRTSSQVASYSCSDNFYYDDRCSDNGVPSFYNYSYGVNAGSLNPAESTTVTLKYGLGSHEEDGVVYPDYLFVLNGYYENDSTISDTLYNVLVNVCNQDVNCAKERMALRNVELIDVFSGSAVDGDATVPITTSFGIDATNASGLPPKPDPFNPDPGLLPVENSGITFVIAGFEQSTSNAYGYHATIKQTGNWVDGLEKTVISGAYAEPVASRGVAEFLGWSEDPVATVPTYKNADEIANNLNAVNGDAPVTLYAIYHHAEIEMQNLHPSLCTESGIYVYDNRDNKIYFVGRTTSEEFSSVCVMMENLALNLGDPNIQQELSDTNTNADDHSLQCLISGEYNGEACTDGYAVSGVVDDSAIYAYDSPVIETSGENWTADDMTWSYGGTYRKHGIAYNYCAATAGSSCGAENDSSWYTHIRGIDICPKGWKAVDWDRFGIYGVETERRFREEVSITSGSADFWNVDSYQYNDSRNVKVMHLGRNLNQFSGGYYSSPGEYRYRLSKYYMRCQLKINDIFMVNFDANGGTGAMAPQEIGINIATALTANSFTAPADMVFDGWNTMPDGSGTSYTDGQQVTNIANAWDTITLYAQWKQGAITFDRAYELAGKTRHNGYYTMQDGTSTICANVTVRQTGILIDVRDDQIYNVGKLADGRCWMIEDLNIAGGTALSASDTDVTSVYIGGFATQANLTKSGNTIVLPSSSTTGFGNVSEAFIYNSENKTDCGDYGETTPCYSYYSWTAATLGGMQSTGAVAETGDGYNAAASICPKSWRLPTSTTSDATATSDGNWKTGDWYALATAYGADLENDYRDSSVFSGSNFADNAGPSTMPDFRFGGHYQISAFNTGGGGRTGLYWSATSLSGTRAYGMGFAEQLTEAAKDWSRGGGLHVRCLMR